MTDQEEQQLRELAADLSALAASPWEPRAISAAFAARAPGAPVLTMQRWIDLDALHSPLLTGRIPDDLGELEASARLFDLSVDALPAEQALLVASQLRDAVVAGFSTSLRMRQPGARAEGGRSDGFGGWAPLFTFLLTECFLSLEEARAIPVRQAFVLLATRRRNQGWEAAEASYAEREMVEANPSHEERPLAFN